MTLGFMFPGQGSQTVGMLADLAEVHPIIGEHFAEAEEIIAEPLWEIARNGPAERLASTEITQPALLVSSVALWSVWQASGGAMPVMMAGHSLGEYSALVCAGAITFADGVALVHERGKLMQQAVPAGQGTMAAILGLDEAELEACCRAVDGIVAPANFNAPGQVVIAGAKAAVEAAVERCKQAGARRAVLLPVSGPFHCELMRPAQEAFAQRLDEIALAMPKTPVVHNVDGQVAGSVAELKAKLMAQIAEPVLWTRCVQAMAAGGVTRLVECGPGKVLSGLVKRIDKKLSADSLSSIEGLEAALRGNDDHDG